MYHLGKPERKKANHPDYVPSIFIYKSDREVSVAKEVKTVPICNEKEWKMFRFWKYILKECCMCALRENPSSNFGDVKNMDVADNAGASKTVSFASTVLEIDFELIDLTAQDATPVPVTSSTPMRNKEKTGIDIDETKNSDTSKEFLQIYTKEIENLHSERDDALEKIKTLEKKSTFLMKIQKRTMPN